MDPKDSLAKVTAFNEDALSHGGYLYSTKPSLSSKLAHQRITDAVFDIVPFYGRTVLDIGCGDGVYTVGLLEGAAPARVHGTDLAIEAVRLVSRKPEAKAITLDVASAYKLPFASDAFDVAHLRAVLHHMEHPELAIQEAMRVAREIVVAEPNGNNPGVKLFEKLSPYHRAHQEKSYSSSLLGRWVRESGGVITRARWIGLVPTFCPDWLAKLAKLGEPHLEASKLLSPLGCSIYVFVARRAAQVAGSES
jgi:SAM-dependent methyltransferase